MVHAMKRIIDILFTLLVWGMLLGSLVYLLCIWRTLPQTIGVHFASDGSFDVYDSKWYIAYPYVVGFGLLGLLERGIAVSRKVSSGMPLHEVGEKHLKTAIGILLRALKLYVSVFFTHWACCVMTQTPLNQLFSRIIAWAVIVLFLVFSLQLS